MTDEEKQEIIEAVIEEINGNTIAVEDMPLAEDLDALVPGIDGEGAAVATPVPSILGQHMTLTQAEYDALIDAGTVDDNVYYYIVEEQA